MDRQMLLSKMRVIFFLQQYSGAPRVAAVAADAFSNKRSRRTCRFLDVLLRADKVCSELFTSRNNPIL